MLQTGREEEEEEKRKKLEEKRNRREEKEEKTRPKVFRIVPKCFKMSQNVPKCPKISTLDASLSEWTCSFFYFISIFFLAKISEKLVHHSDTIPNPTPLGLRPCQQP